nr:uncharacterized protein c17h9.06c [Quercus suber]
MWTSISASSISANSIRFVRRHSTLLASPRERVSQGSKGTTPLTLPQLITATQHFCRHAFTQMARSKRNYQSRLTFTPLPSSSPASKGYPQQVRDRAAAVSFESSPSPAKRRRVDHGGGVESIVVAGRANGAKGNPSVTAGSRQNYSSASDSEGEDSDPVRSTQRSQRTSRRRFKQRRLEFGNARSPESFDTPIRLAPSSLPHSSSTRSGMFASQGRNNKVLEESSGDESDVSGKSSSPDQGSTVAKGSRRRQDGVRTGAEEGSKELRPSQAPVAIGSDGEEENIVISSSRTKGRHLQDESEDEMPSTIGKLPRQHSTKKQKRRNSLDDFISSSPPQAVSDDDVIIIAKPIENVVEAASESDEVTQTSRKRRRPVVSDKSESEDEDTPLVTPRRRRLKRPKQLTQTEKDDLEDDLNFLRPSSDEEISRAPRSTQSTQKSARMQALEKLKQKRAGQVETISEEGDGGSNGLVDDEDDFGEADQDDAVDEVQITSSRQMFRETEEDEDFIEEEPEDGVLGVPEGIPLQFTRYGSMKAKQLFKYAIEWMVQKKINPAFQMTDEIYTLTFNKLDDEVQGLAGSKFTSSAWTPEFTIVMKARPEIIYNRMDRSGLAGLLHDKCDACNRSGHPATYEVQFDGKPYHIRTLEEVGGNDEDDDESNDEDESDDGSSVQNKYGPQYDSHGHALPATDKIYYVGKFCMANAQTAHALQHWRIHLNDWVVDWLTKQGYNAPAEVVKRDKLSVRKRRKIANKIVDRMDKEGVVKQLYREFRGNIDVARESKQGRFGGADSP